MLNRRLALLSHLRIVLLLVLLLAFTGTGEAQKGAPPAPQAPTLNIVMPLGIQRGTSLDLALTGANLAEPVAFWTTIPGAKIVIPTENNNGKEPGKLLVKIEVPKDAPLGVHAVRLATTRGLSNLRLFCVDDLPQVVADGKNKTAETAQMVPVPCVAAGVIAAESRDYYKFKAQAGQRLSFEVLGRRLGSIFDPQISIIDPKNGRELAHNNDGQGLQTDPRITHTFKDAGDYLIEIRDVQYRGAADYGYRLRIGDFPCATAPIPMAAKRGSKVQVSFAGPAVEGVTPVEVSVPAEPAGPYLLVTPIRSGSPPGWPVALAVSNVDEVVEKEPNNDIAQANEVPVPGGVTGRIHQKGDIDFYKLNLKKAKYIIEAHTAELGSPTDVYMSVKSDKGADLAKTALAGPARLEFTPPADGTFYLTVEHLHQTWGGPADSYHISILPEQQSFEIALASDGVDVPQGQAAVLGIQSVFRTGYKGPIEVSIVGHPGIKGQTTIGGNIESKPGPAQPDKGPAKAAANLVIQVNPDVGMGAYPLQVQCKATINGQPVIKFATVEPALSKALAGLPYPPRNLLRRVEVGVSEKPPFSLTTKLEPPDVLKGGTANVTITADRGEGFGEEIAINPADLPPNVTFDAKGLKIEKGKNEVKAVLKVAAAAVNGDYTVAFSGRAKHNNRDYVVTSLPAALEIALPFELKVEPAQVPIDAAGKAKIKVVAVRKGGYQGPIALVVQNLPANVTAPKVNIDQGKDDAEIELTAANAAAGDKPDVNIQGTATAAGNQVGTSPPFTVTVQKK